MLTRVSLNFNILIIANLTFVIGIIFCRVFMNRATAVAHQRVFQEIEKLVEMDTRQRLKWRHLHATSSDDYVGILHWTADQHGGQAKGMSKVLNVTRRMS